MIKLKNIKKYFSNVEVLKGINFSFPECGFFAVCGPSGCGKTTLLNIISLLEDFEGEISFNNRKYSSLSNQDADYLRNNEIGFIFQDYKLFDFDSVQLNIKLALDMKSSDGSSFKGKKILDLLNFVGLSNKANALVSTLSGGEKQRLSIARAICNSPKVLLADEPTGNLDEENTQKIMELLQKISKSSLVIMVSHDEQMCKKYSDVIIEMADGTIIKKISNKPIFNKSRLSTIKLKTEKSKGKIDSSFCIKHTINSIKKRKWRTSLIIVTTALGLVGVGLGSVISNIISTNLYNSYSSIIEENKVILTPKNSYNKKRKIYSISDDDFYEIKEKNLDNINYDGTYYQNNFLTFFDYYSFSIENLINSKVLPVFSPQYFNDYMNIKDCYTPIYCCENYNLSNNEMILSLTPGLLNEICFQLNIVRTVDSFKNYLLNNNLFIDVFLQNSNWNYFNEFSLQVVGFTMGNIDCFVHSSNHWNEYIYENICQFPSTDVINNNTSHPWDIKKIRYLCVKSKETFLKNIMYSASYENVVGEVLNYSYYPVLYSKTKIENCNRVGLYQMDYKNDIPAKNYPYIKSISNHIKSSMIGSNNCYAMYPNNLMMGFAKQLFVSTDSNYLENVIDIESYIKTSDDKIVNPPNHVAIGYFAKSDGIKFSTDFVIQTGKIPTNYDEIVISQGLVEYLGIINPINKSIYVCYPKNEDYLSNGYIKRDYEMTDIKIVGVSNTNKLEFNHDDEWPLLFFQTKLSISSFDTNLNSISLSVEDGYIDEVIAKVEKGFPFLYATNPISQITESVDEVCNKIEIILLILSISSVVISSILLSICNYIHFVEIKRDIGLIRCLGANKKESKKLIYSHSLFMATLSFLLSIIELLILCFFLSLTMSDTLGIEAVFVFNPLSILYMFVICYSIAIVSSFIISSKINKLSPLECLSS